MTTFVLISGVALFLIIGLSAYALIRKSAKEPRPSGTPQGDDYAAVVYSSAALSTASLSALSSTSCGDGGGAGSAGCS